MLLDSGSGDGDGKGALESQQQPIHRFLLMQPNKFQFYPSKTVTKFKVSHKQSHSQSIPQNAGYQPIADQTEIHNLLN